MAERDQEERQEERVAVTDAAGRRGEARLGAAAEDAVFVTFDEGTFLVARAALEPRGDGFYLPQDVTVAAERVERLELAEEELHVGKRERTRRLLIRKAVETRTEDIEIPLEHTEVEVTRVPVDKPVSERPETRTEGDVTIIPVLEERLVVETRLFLKEELHVRSKTTREVFRDRALLREEVATLEREAEE